MNKNHKEIRYETSRIPGFIHQGGTISMGKQGQLGGMWFLKMGYLKSSINFIQFLQYTFLNLTNHPICGSSQFHGHYMASLPTQHARLPVVSSSSG